MLKKEPKSFFARKLRKGAKILFVVESVLFFSSFGVWYKLNRERDFRFTVKQYFPSILEGFYTVGEYFDKTNKCRDLDYTVWKNEGKIFD